MDATSRPLRVLIVDDERDALMTLGILLRSEGMEVRLAKEGMEVGPAVTQFGPDAVLLDLGMPDRSGLQIARDLRRSLGHDCPVLIAVTGHNTEADKYQTSIAGFRYHVAKPYDPDALLKLISSIERRES